MVVDWLQARDPEWRAQITHVAIDLSAVYGKTARAALPQAKLIAERFHLVKTAHGRRGVPQGHLDPARTPRTQGRR